MFKSILKKTLVFVSFFFVVSSCSLSLGNSGEGTVTLQWAQPQGISRALLASTWIPEFSSVQVSVSGPGMNSRLYDVPPGQTTLSIEVPAGDDRVFSLYMVPDWPSTLALRPAEPQLTLVKAYGGTATANVSQGLVNPISITLEASETKILLPEVVSAPNGLRTANSVSGSAATLVPMTMSSTSHFAFDRYGRLYYTYGNTILTSLGGGVPTTAYNGIMATYTGLAYDKVRDRLIAFSEYGASTLDIIDFSLATPEKFTLSNSVGSYTLGNSFGRAVAVDSAGDLYVSATGSSTAGILKLRIVSLTGGVVSATVLDFKTYEDLDFGYTESSTFYPMNLHDLTVIEGRLYALLGHHNSTSRGKVVEVNPSNLTKVRDLGWTSTANFPVNASSQFYGPKRIIGLKPKKLIIADEGRTDSPIVQVDRVVEVDLDSWAISDIGLDGEVSFFETFFC